MERNPLIPAGYDIVWSVLFLAVLALTIVAVISLARSAARLTPLPALLWVLVVLFVPVLGAITWLAVGRPARERAVARSPHLSEGRR